ncbi:hypothetical protein Tco_0933413 [Tanacetum coccineum]
MEKLVLSLVFTAKRLRGKTTKIERHARRTQYHLPAKDVCERTDLSRFPRRKPDENLPKTPATDIPQEPWTLYTDGSSCIDGSRAGLILTSPEGTDADRSTQCAQKVKSLVLVEILKEKSIHEEEVATVVEEEGTTWMTPIIEYLKDGTLPGDRKEASKLCIKVRQYKLLEGILYKQSFLKPLLRCVGPLQEDYVI